jgi:hypothetical protein
MKINYKTIQRFFLGKYLFLFNFENVLRLDKEILYPAFLVQLNR